MKEIQGLELYSYEEIIELIRDYIIDVLLENGYSDEDVEILDIALNGSRLRGQAKEDSDLDAVVSYAGDTREDDLFTLFHEDPLYIDDIEVDINPINEDETDFDDYMRSSAEYDKLKLLK